MNKILTCPRCEEHGDGIPNARLLFARIVSVEMQVKVIKLTGCITFISEWERSTVLGFLILFACDISPRAIEMVKSNSLYNEEIINAFVYDLTKDDICIESESVDLVSLIFVLSAILPNYFETILKKLFKVLRPGGLLLFRDYGVYDMAMIRFGPGSKLAEKLYVRQDGTGAYYFTVEELHTLFTSVGFEVICNEYVSRQTVNLKEGINAQRVFVQAKCRKPHKMMTQPS
ncbi:Methyltransferase-like protein 6 [Armadillidium nasatum]|uniref:Methyltransferase-like protein 6 n=1 Tax=Armadillidium nasatum TaxID=96803 RepID=A0A5N5TIQ6_9CRUS|nr:Methyltransferase-like protein 6 [Armadillidium nasatum]